MKYLLNRCEYVWVWHAAKSVCEDLYSRYDTRRVITEEGLSMNGKGKWIRDRIK